MQFVVALKHLFIPHHTNNQKARLLHSSSLMALSLLLILFQFGLRVGSGVVPKILGYAANISVEEVVRLTNEKRAANGLAPLTMNQQLVSGATAKGADMLARDYWAHVAPDGTQPWKFFSDAGYKYRYAGENLARDFSNANSAVEAWMASPSHRENLLSSKYSEIGIAVVEGDLAGADTTIIVQFFGTKQGVATGVQPVSAKTAVAEAPAPEVVKETKPVLQYEKTAGDLTAVTSNISPFNLFKGVSMGIVELLIVLVIADALYVSIKGVSRVAGRSFAHLSFMGMILAILLILKSGQIL